MVVDLAERARRIEALAEIPGPDATVELAEILREPSWYLRERAVLALARRTDALDAVISVVESGAWFAKASACDALGRLGDERALNPLVARVLDRNVSVQKSATEAIFALVELHGVTALARALEPLTPGARRATAARIAHQVPDLAARLAAALPPGEPFDSADQLHDEATSLRRFRAWLTTTHPGGA